MNHQHDPYTPPQAALDESKSKPQISQNAIQGIGGWLILPLIGLVLTPLRNLVDLPELFPTFEADTWRALTTAGFESYHPLWGPTIVFELVFILFLIIFPIYVLWRVIQKSSKAPKLFIILLVVTFVAQIIDTIAISVLAQQFSEIDAGDNFRELTRSFFGVLIWVPYFLKSERVKNTFIN